MTSYGSNDIQFFVNVALAISQFRREDVWITAEQRWFTNWYPFQMFNVGGAVFYDMGSTWGRDPLGTPSQGLLKDAGFGLRLGNSRSALGNVLHIDVAFPFDGDSSIKNVQFLVETKRTFLR